LDTPSYVVKTVVK